METIKQAVILAGGQGTRLRPLTSDRPKPIVLINGRPFLEYLINLLRENEIEEVVLLLGYLPEKITEYFGDGSRYGIKIKYHIGKVEDETGTRLRNAKNLLRENFLLMYGDNYWPMGLAQMFYFYRKAGVLASTTIYNNKDGRGEYGPENNVYIGDDSRVLKYDKERKDVNLNGVDIGFFILNKRVADFFPDRNFSFEREILSKLVDMKQLVGYQTDHPYYWLTTPESISAVEKFLTPKKVVFLDRDGVINKKMPEHDYVKKWNEFEFLPGAVEAIKLLHQNGYKIFIITNQRGIGRGLMNEDDLKSIHGNMIKELENNGAVISGIYHCPHNYEDNCDCRKPKADLFFSAARDNHVDLTKAIFIGDDETDLEAGKTAKCKTYLVGPDKGLLEIVKSFINQ